MEKYDKTHDVSLKQRTCKEEEEEELCEIIEVENKH